MRGKSTSRCSRTRASRVRVHGVGRLRARPEVVQLHAYGQRPRELRSEQETTAAAQPGSDRSARDRIPGLTALAPLTPIAPTLAALAPVVLSIALDFVPYLGPIKIIVESIRGKDTITGDSIPTWARVLGPLGLAASNAGKVGKVLRCRKAGANRSGCGAVAGRRSLAGPAPRAGRAREGPAGRSAPNSRSARAGEHGRRAHRKSSRRKAREGSSPSPRAGDGTPRRQLSSPRR